MARPAAERGTTDTVSLKAFHVFFIAIAGFTSLLFGLWAVRDWRVTGSTTNLVLGLISFAVLLSLIPYGRWFLRKFKKESYL